MKHYLHYLISCCTITACILLNGNEGKAQGNYDIYVFDVKFGTSKRITSISNASKWNASWSNNGKKIAHDYAPSDAPQSIYITDVQTGVSIPLAGAEGGNDAAWSPNGTRIAFDNWQNIFSVPANGGIRSLLRINSHHASWSPKGNKISFDDNSGFIGTKDVNTGLETLVTYYGDRPSWSPNGQYIAFDGWSWIGGGVWVVKVDTLGNPHGWPVQLTTSGYGPTWKNNSKEIVFIDWPDGDPDLYSVPVTGGSETKVCGRVGGFDKGDYDPSYSNNGQFIAWSSYTDNSPARVTNTSKENSIIKSADKNDFTLLQNYPNPFRDETKISFQITESTHVLLNIYNMAGQKIQTLINANYTGGNYTISWNGKDRNGSVIPGGVYIYQLQTKNGCTEKSMCLQR